MRRLLAFLQALHIDPLEAVLLAMLAATMALLVVDLVQVADLVLDASRRPVAARQPALYVTRADPSARRGR